jgi:hypothetical protein
MTVHQCPKCELRFNFATELDYHCRTEHPDFRHEYPVGRPAATPPTADNEQPAGPPTS